MNEEIPSLEAEVDARLDKSLALLKYSTSLDSRFKVLQDLVRYWHGAISPENGMTDEELQGLLLPEPLRRWYRWAGNRTEIMSGQNFLFSPKETLYDFRKLRLEDDRLLFHIENQGVYEWATLPEGEDPPVFGRSNGGPWQPEDVRLSEHLILTCVFEAILCHASYSASNAWLAYDQLNQITKKLLPLAIPAWRWPGRTRFYAGGGAFMCVAEYQVHEESGFSIWIGAKTQQRLKFLAAYVDETWEHVDL